MPAHRLTPPPRAPKTYKHLGFLAVSRRALGFGALAACAGMAALAALPATAGYEPEIAVVDHSQSFVAPAALASSPIVRDGFAVTNYSVVQWPVPSSTSMASGFGYRSCSGCSTNHEGIDLNPGSGFPIQAVADGVVSQVGNPSGSFGVFVVIDHVVDGQAVSTTYAHMQLGSMNLNVGDSVDRGQVIGAVGNTGSSTGPHLHFAVSIGGVYIDPLPWLGEHVNI